MGLTETIQRIEELYGQLLASAERAQERDARRWRRPWRSSRKERHELRRTVEEGKRIVRLAAERAEASHGAGRQQRLQRCPRRCPPRGRRFGAPRRGVPLCAAALAGSPPCGSPGRSRERERPREVSRDTSGPAARHVAGQARPGGFWTVPQLRARGGVPRLSSTQNEGPDRSHTIKGLRPSPGVDGSPRSRHSEKTDSP